MNGRKEVIQEFHLKKLGINFCYFTMVFIVVCNGGLLMKNMPDSFGASIITMSLGLPFFSIFQALVPIISLLMFFSSNRLMQIHAMALIIPYIILFPIFWIIALGDYAKDAQGALIFLFGPIYVQGICLGFLIIFSFIYAFFRKIKKREWK